MIGAGATSVVHRGESVATGRPVALKVIHRELCGNKQIFGRYQREAKILERLRGPNIVEFLDFIVHGELLVIALELVDGAPLDRVLRTPLDLGLAVEVTIQIAEGLAAAHRAGVIHRDLKPANVVVEPRGWPGAGSGAPRVRILDFGLAKVIHGEHMTTGLTEHDMIFGTPEYMSPEQARGDDLDGRSDVYSAGVILYEMATGAVPFAGRTPLATMTAHLTEPLVRAREVAPARAISATLDTVIARALSKEPAERYESAEAFMQALRAVSERRLAGRAGAESRIATTEMELGETDLAVRLSQVPIERKQAIEGRATSGISGPPPGISVAPSEVGGRWWIVVGILVAGAAIAAGVYFAFR
ncbi:MAG: serine/threonine-protein kinase [Polyangiaceae bacterium]